ncbi:MAG TPA: ImmA/IrrE family metallo-endopeptidase [Candidatus Saccharimonadales bacterium]
MNKIKPIRTDQDYEDALVLLGELVSKDPNPESEEGDQLSILSTLIETYEANMFPQDLPSPIEAIKFRMEQAGLRSSDLIPYIGSRSRVSEVLSGKRPLTVDMIRALEQGLGIPAKVLIKKPEQDEDAIFQSWDNRLLKLMSKRGYFDGETLETKSGYELLKEFFTSSPIQAPALLRQSKYRLDSTTDRYALAAWSAYLLKEAKKAKPSSYKPNTVTLEFMQEIAKLSTDEKGPLLAQKLLSQKGIVLVIEPSFPKTRLDGAAILTDAKVPIIGLTLRQDRLDNFWFTLMHELAHISLHYDNGSDGLFYDDLSDIRDVDTKEKEADNLASEALVPTDKWEVSPARLVPSPMAATSLARDIGVNVAIIAGKVRYESGNWSYLNKVVGQEKVRKYFPGKEWE